MKRYGGVVIGLVEGLDDPRGEGRIQISFPWLPGMREKPWAPVAVPFAGNDRGLYFYPEQGDEVLVAFEQGDFDHPFIVGFLWNGQDQPPANDPNLRYIRSVKGHGIEIYDNPIGAGGELGGITIRDAYGNVIEWANGRITIRSVSTVEIQALSINMTGAVTVNGQPIGLI